MSSPWPHDDNASLIAFYGDPSHPAWATTNLVPFFPPFAMQYKDDSGKVSSVAHFIVHQKIKPALTRIMLSLWATCGHRQASIQAAGLQWYGGCYAPRNVRGSLTKLSCHAFGAAIDLDPSHEPRGRSSVSHWPAFVPAAFKAEGCYWGQDYINSPKDPMHFQFAHE